MVQKLEEFLFDIVGLLVPGMVVFFTFGLTLFSMVNWKPFINNVNLMRFNNSILMHNVIVNKLSWGKDEVFYFMFMYLIISYLLGHIAKVFSKYFYGFGVVIFDDLIILSVSKAISLIINNRILQFIKDKLQNRPKAKKIVSWIRKLYKEFKMLFLTILEFKCKNYGSEKIANKVLQILNQKSNLNLTLQKNWYEVYKLSTITMEQKKIKSLNQRFLAKYNFYRSLSFVLFMNFVLVLYLLKFKSYILNEAVLNYYPYLVLLVFISWLTFHEKFKRYWKLCGSEALLVVMAYYINKDEVPENEE